MEGKVLVVQLARLGDLVQTWPLLRRLRHQGPGQSLDLLADSLLQGLHGLGPDLDQVWGLEIADLSARAHRDLPGAYERLHSLAAGFRGRRYGRVYNLNFSRVALLFAYLAGGEVRGYRPVNGGRDFLRDPWLALVYALVHARQVNRVHLSDVFRHLAPGGGHEPGAPVPAARSGEPIVALQMATRHQRRTWPLKSFTRLAGLFVKRLGAWVWLLGTKAEAQLGEALQMGLSPALRERVINLQGRTDLRELAVRLQEAHLLVSGDTGTLHLAAALGTRTLGVFMGPASCFETGPYGEGHWVFQAEPPCHPCAEAGGGCPEAFCQAMIPPEAVADVAVSLCTGGGVASPISMPAGTRLYRSAFDPLGVSYLPVGTGYRFIDLVGLAYRRAGAQLLGLPWPTRPLPSPVPGEDDRQNLERLAATLKKGGSAAGHWQPWAKALAPLQAYRREMERQQRLGRAKEEAVALLEKVECGLQAGLEELGAAGG